MKKPEIENIEELTLFDKLNETLDDLDDSIRFTHRLHNDTNNYLHSNIQIDGFKYKFKLVDDREIKELQNIKKSDKSLDIYFNDMLNKSIDIGNNIGFLSEYLNKIYRKLPLNKIELLDGNDIVGEDLPVFVEKIVMINHTIENNYRLCNFIENWLYDFFDDDKTFQNKNKDLNDVFKFLTMDEISSLTFKMNIDNTIANIKTLKNKIYHIYLKFQSELSESPVNIENEITE